MLKTLLTTVSLLLLVACSNPTPEGPDISSSKTPLSTTTPLPTRTEMPTQTPTLTPSATPEPQSERFTSILLGADRDPRRPERTRFGNRTDVFVIITWLDHWEYGVTDVAIFSVPRDLWVRVDCSPLDPSLNGFDRINAAFTYGGFDCVRSTVETNFGLEVNAPIFFTEMLPFVEIVDIFDPLEVTATQTYTDWCGDFQGTEGGHGASITWQAGRTYEMDGNYVLCYVRARANAPTGDLDRNRRAIEVLNAMIDQYPNELINDPLAVVPELLGFWMRVKDLIDSDIQITDIVKLAPMAYRAIDGIYDGTVDWKNIRLTLDEVSFYTTPIYGASVLISEVDLYGWTDCMLSAGPIHLQDGKLVCTSTHLVNVEG